MITYSNVLVYSCIYPHYKYKHPWYQKKFLALVVKYGHVIGKTRFVYKSEATFKHGYTIFYLFSIFQLLNHIDVLYRNSSKPKIVFNYFEIKYKPNIAMWITIPACFLSHTILYVQIWRAPFTKQTKSHFMVLKNCFLFALQESQHGAYFKAFYIRHIS